MCLFLLVHICFGLLVLFNLGELQNAIKQDTIKGIHSLLPLDFQNSQQAREASRLVKPAGNILKISYDREQMRISGSKIVRINMQLYKCFFEGNFIVLYFQFCLEFFWNGFQHQKFRETHGYLLQWEASTLQKKAEPSVI